MASSARVSSSHRVQSVAKICDEVEAKCLVEEDIAQLESIRDLTNQAWQVLAQTISGNSPDCRSLKLHDTAKLDPKSPEARLISRLPGLVSDVQAVIRLFGKIDHFIEKLALVSPETPGDEFVEFEDQDLVSSSGLGASSIYTDNVPVILTPEASVRSGGDDFAASEPSNKSSKKQRNRRKNKGKESDSGDWVDVARKPKPDSAKAKTDGTNESVAGSTSTSKEDEKKYSIPFMSKFLIERIKRAEKRTGYAGMVNGSLGHLAITGTGELCCALCKTAAPFSVPRQPLHMGSVEAHLLSSGHLDETKAERRRENKLRLQALRAIAAMKDDKSEK